jgi:hypothetical protein
MHRFVSSKQTVASVLVASLLVGLWAPAIHSSAYAKTSNSATKQDEKDDINYQLDVWGYMENDVYPNAIRSLKSRNPSIDTSDVQTLGAFLTKRARDPSFAKDRLFHNLYQELNMKMSTASSGKYNNLAFLYGVIKLNPVNPISRGAYQLRKTVTRTFNPPKAQQPAQKPPQQPSQKAERVVHDRRSEAYKRTVRTELEKVYTSALKSLGQSNIDVSNLPKRLDHFLMNVNKEPSYLNTTPGAKTIYTSLNEQSLSLTSNYYGLSTENKPGYLGKIESLGFFTTKEFINTQTDPKSKPPVDPKRPSADKQSVEYRDSIKRFAEAFFIQKLTDLKKSSPELATAYKRLHNINDLFKQMNKRKDPLDLAQHPKIIQILNNLNVAVYAASSGAYGKTNKDTFGTYGGFERLFDYSTKLKAGCDLSTVVYGVLGIPSVISINRLVNNWSMTKSIWNAIMFVPTDTLQTCFIALSLAGDGIDLAFISDKQLRLEWENIINGVAVGIAIRNILNIVVAIFEKTVITPTLTTTIQKTKDIFLVSIKKQPLKPIVPMNVHLSWVELFQGGAMVTLAVSGTVHLNSYVQCDANAFGTCMNDSQPTDWFQWLQKNISFALFLGLGVMMWPISGLMFKLFDRIGVLIERQQWINAVLKASRSGSSVPLPKSFALKTATTPTPKTPPSPPRSNPIKSILRKLSEIPLPKPLENMLLNVDRFINPRKYVTPIAPPGALVPLSVSAQLTRPTSMLDQSDVAFFARYYDRQLMRSAVKWPEFARGILFAITLPAMQYLIAQALVNPPTYAKELPRIKTEFETFMNNLIALRDDIAISAILTFFISFSINFLKKHKNYIDKFRAAFDAGKSSLNRQYWLIYGAFIVVIGSMEYLSGMHELSVYTKLDKDNRLKLDSDLLSDSISTRNTAIQLFNNSRAIQVNPLYHIHKLIDPSISNHLETFQSLLAMKYNLNVTN